VWFGTEVSEDGNHSVGHSKSYVKVLVPRDEGLLAGKIGIVEITSTSKFHVTGTIIPSTLQDILTSPLPPLVNHCNLKSTKRKNEVEKENDEEEEEKETKLHENTSKQPQEMNEKESGRKEEFPISSLLILLLGMSLIAFGIYQKEIESWIESVIIN